VNRLLIVPVLVLAVFVVACGDSEPPPPLGYTDPGPGGALRLIRNPATTPSQAVLDLVVGDQPLTGYATGFDLALDATKVTLTAFTPGTALAPGSDPVAARGVIPTTGPLAGMLVTAQSQKAAGTGAVTTDTTLAPGTVLFTVTLELAPGATTGVVFDGTAPGFVLASGGLRDRTGLMVVDASGVAIGKLEAHVAPP
jgi:hypothetical protein